MPVILRISLSHFQLQLKSYSSSSTLLFNVTSEAWADLYIIERNEGHRQMKLLAQVQEADNGSS